MDQFSVVLDATQTRRQWLLSTLATLGTASLLPRIVIAAEPAVRFDVRRNPGCGCCEKWVEHMRHAGYEVVIADDPELAAYKDMLGIPKELQACHTAQGAGYIFEGHVPINLVQRVLRERPRMKGLAVGGMPAGSPGMESDSPVAYDVMAFDGAKAWVYEKITPRKA